jgi:hypothetical protein
MESWEVKEKERIEKIERMFQLANDVGSDKDIVRNTGEMWFKDWQEALNFQTLCRENGLDVRLVEADPKPVSWSGEYNRISPI